MRHMLLAILVVLLLPVPLIAQEVVFKDGKRIKWKSITVMGDKLSIELPSAKRLLVAGDTIERIEHRNVKESPLTGASFSFDKKRKLQRLDLVARFNRKTDLLAGSWRRNGRTLVGSGPPASQPKVEFSNYSPPSEYDLTMVVERTKGANIFTVILVGGGKQVFVNFDWFSGSRSVMGTEIVPGEFFKNNTPRTLKFMVRREGIVVQADGKDFMRWKADWDQVKPLDAQTMLKAKNTLGIRIVAPDEYRISAMVLSAPKQ